MTKIPALTLLLPLSLLGSLPAGAEEEGIRLAPVEHAATLKECSACHMVYAPQMLPVRSWQALMGNLSNHFGEDATLSPDVQKDITDYLVSNAADSKEAAEGSLFLRKLKATDTPLRITETPFWIRAHHEVTPAAFARPDIKSAANCQACHRTADKGEYFEIEED
jgi:hypothetical protein